MSSSAAARAGGLGGDGLDGPRAVVGLVDVAGGGALAGLAAARGPGGELSTSGGRAVSVASPSPRTAELRAASAAASAGRGVACGRRTAHPALAATTRTAATAHTRVVAVWR